VGGAALSACLCIAAFFRWLPPRLLPSEQSPTGADASTSSSASAHSAPVPSGLQACELQAGFDADVALLRGRMTQPVPAIAQLMEQCGPRQRTGAAATPAAATVAATSPPIVSASTAEATVMDDKRWEWLPTLQLAIVVAQVALVEYPLLWWYLGREPFGWVVDSQLRTQPLHLLLVGFWAGCLLLTVRWLPCPSPAADAHTTASLPARPSRFQSHLAEERHIRRTAQKSAPESASHLSHSDRDEGGVAKAPDATSGSSPYMTLPVAIWQSLTPARRKLIVRKAFHILVFLMLAPALCLGPRTATFLCLALAVASKTLLLLELMRAFRMPPTLVSWAIDGYMHAFTDDRDSGLFVLTHLYLLLGCAVPVWIAAPAAPAVTAPGAAWGVGAFAGLLGLGVGDALAAVAGIAASTLGRAHRWGDVLYTGALRWPSVAAAFGLGPDPVRLPSATAAVSSGDERAEARAYLRARIQGMPGHAKTVEGTVAFVVGSFALALLAIFAQGPAAALSLAQSATLFACLVAAALLETFTASIDNALVPLYLFLLLRRCLPPAVAAAGA
jgi:dolichol kinase